MSCPKKPMNYTEISHEHTTKGCIHWYDLTRDSDITISSQRARPYMIIGAENPKSIRVIISPISDRIHYVEQGTNKLKYPYHAPLFKDIDVFLEKDSVVLLDQVYTISKSDLCKEWFMGKISNNLDLDKAILYSYDLFESMFTIYKELFQQLDNKAKEEHLSNYTRK